MMRTTDWMNDLDLSRIITAIENETKCRSYLIIDAAYTTNFMANKCEYERMFPCKKHTDHWQKKTKFYFFVLCWGQHWSLVVYYRETQKFYGYDSKDGLHRSYQLEFCKRLREHEEFSEAEGYCPSGFVPQQIDSWECGYFVAFYIFIMFTKGEVPRPISLFDVKHYLQEYVKNFIKFLQSIKNKEESALKSAETEDQREILTKQRIVKSDATWLKVISELKNNA